MPVNPNVVFPPAGIAPLYDAFATLTLPPLRPSVPFHTWVMPCPLGSVHFTVQPFNAVVDDLSATVTFAWKPPDQLLVMLYVALQPVPPDGELALGEGLALAEGLELGDGLALAEGVALADGLGGVPPVIV